MQEKLAITVLVITLALFALVMVLYNLMTTKKDDYNQIVLSQQEYDSRTIPFKRGDILDRNGTYLATSEKVYNLILDPKQIMSNEKLYFDASVDALVDCFGYDRTEISNLIREKKDKAYIKYDKQLSFEQKENFEKYSTEKKKVFKDEKEGRGIRGIWFEDEYRRVYPYNSVACNLIGFLNSDGLGGTGGIEQFYNSTLMGTNGREYGYLNDDSNLERVIKPAINGNSIVSTIDANVQKIVEKYIAEWEAQTGSKRVGVIVMDPNNGEVLAMANDKSFDLNNPRQLRPEYTDDVIKQLGIKEAIDDYHRKNKDAEPLTEETVYAHYSNDEIMSLGTQVAWNQTWRNFCISDGYEPGSTAKIFTVASALEEGAITGNEHYECGGKLEIGGWPISCVNRFGHGDLTVEQGLMKSCNVVMMRIAQTLGKQKFYKYQQMFGFGSKTGIDLPAEESNQSQMYNAETTNPASLATNSFGQNFNCTMIQMAAAYCSVINGGSYYEPHVVKQVLNEQGSVVKKVDPVLVRETVSESTSKFINEALFKTVNAPGGTGSAARVEGYAIAGKTGTAEKIPRDHKNYVVSFCGYAPADNPQVLVYVVIDEPHVEDQPHSTFASGVFQKIMTEILPYLNIFPDTDIVPDTSGQHTELPSEEGITSETESTAEGESEAGSESGSAAETLENGETIPPEAVNPSEEVVVGPSDDETRGLPAAVPGESSEAVQIPPATTKEAEAESTTAVGESGGR